MINREFPDAQNFSAELINGKITMLDSQNIGELTPPSLKSTNEKYLRHLYQALNELFQRLDNFRGIRTEAIEEYASEIDNTPKQTLPTTTLKNCLNG